MYTKDEFQKDWKHVCNHINFGASNLDADSIRFMNEGPHKIINSLAQRDALLEACRAVYQDIELQNVKGGSNELNIMVQQAIAQAEKP